MLGVNAAWIRHRMKGAAAVTLAAALLMLGCSPGGGGGGGGGNPGPEPPPPEEFTGSVDDFYVPPDPVPAYDPGTLLRYQEIPDLDVAGSTAYRILYVSRSLQDKPIAVSGTSLVPGGEAPADGRRLLGMAHGMTGIADMCAPSKTPNVADVVLTGKFIEAGYLVSMTDFEGLGTPGRHPFVVGDSEGRGTIDGIRAARQLPNVGETSDQLALAGYSQGGHASLFAGEIVDEWAPEFDHVATFAGAPGTELDVIAAAVPSMPALAGVFYLAAAGFNAGYPDADLSTILTPTGVDSLKVVDEGCAGHVYDYYRDQDPKSLLQPNHTEAQPWKDLIQQNNPGHDTSEAPIFVYHSSSDELIPVQLSGIMVDRMCANGQVVERVTPDSGGHGPAAPPSYAAAFDWIQARFEGQPPTSSC